MGTLDTDGLDLLIKERRSTKHLEGGPMVHGRQSPYGKAKVPTALPKQLKDSEFGISSYHKGSVSDIKNILTSESLRENMLEKIQNYLTQEVIYDKKQGRR